MVQNYSKQNEQCMTRIKYWINMSEGKMSDLTRVPDTFPFYWDNEAGLRWQQQQNIAAAAVAAAYTVAPAYC